MPVIASASAGPMKRGCCGSMATLRKPLTACATES